MSSVDKELIEKVKLGDEQAITMLINLYKDKIYFLGCRMLGNKEEAEDICQETFIRVYTNIDKYDDNHKFSTWVYKIATNLCIDRIRKNKKNVFSLDNNGDKGENIDLYSIVPDSGLNPEEEVILNEQKNLIQLSFEGLPIKYRTIMILRYVDELKLQEISEILDLPVTTIKTRLHRGREHMRGNLVNNNLIKEEG